MRTSPEEHGYSAIAVAVDGAARTVPVVADTVKPTSPQVTAQLRKLGLTPRAAHQ